MINRHSSRFRRVFVGTFAMIGMLIMCAIVLHWSWNIVANGLFQLPIMEFKHALAVELLLLVFFVITGAGARFLIRGQQFFFIGERG